MSLPRFKLVECPRDAMQGWHSFIPTDKKIEYINALLKVGFHTIDFGSFVSPKAIPQMADTVTVLNALDLEGSSSKLLAIVANQKGADDAVLHEKISYLGFPFSISETFQQRNTRSSIADSFQLVKQIQQLCGKHEKELVVYLSMAFGNPYGDAYDEEVIGHWMTEMAGIGIRIISLADTVGVATAEQVSRITRKAVDSFPGIEVGVHLHSAPANRKEKLQAAFEAGAMRIDAALHGIGGCPMAGDSLVGNMGTEFLLNELSNRGVDTRIDQAALAECSRLASAIFV